ncbi:hypothetical protein A8H39_10770 [Paraburkholderia fungorum]|jgi:hypothetical protein|uniref:hypothetical protein n=1 Tax=Paraburkholderia fungorum TaxID=134537 RepID=UPI0004824B69|nr:hypothetical protein [Paraburkholderia fungorum]MBB5543352.1 hypothetical protein [Paraburkholderia fungorum]PNE56285.1 hypothetical protein A8H39_10770 [Paraburkholderia fungorum]
MAGEGFSLKSREEVVRFEELLDKYMVARSIFAPSHISLASAFDQLQTRPDGMRVFTALFDIQINFFLLFLDSHSVGVTWTEVFAKGKLEGGSILDSEAKFFGKMDVHRFNSAYVLRYRALWDKLMGLIVLTEAPAEYESFMGARSRKKDFRRIAEKHQIANAEFLDSLEGLITRFDNTFRTSEAHGTGRLRKYSLSMESMVDNPQIELIGFWNAMNGFIAEIGKKFGNVSKS